MRVKRSVMLAAFGLAMADITGRQLLKNETRFDFVPAFRHEHYRLIVYVHGTLVDGVNSSLLLMPQFRRRGDVLLVTVTGGRSDVDKTASDVARWINERGTRYDEIVLIGASRGGPTVNKVVPLLGDHDCDLKAIILASPIGMRNFMFPLNIVGNGMWVWWAGPISNITTGKLFLKLFFAKPEERNIEPGVERAELNRLTKLSQAQPISRYADDVRTMLSFRVEPNSMADVDGVYVHCLRDIVASHDSYLPWCEIFGYMLPLVLSDTTHVGFPEMPREFEQDFNKAFELIGVYED